MRNHIYTQITQSTICLLKVNKNIGCLFIDLYANFNGIWKKCYHEEESLYSVSADQRDVTFLFLYAVVFVAINSNHQCENPRYNETIWKPGYLQIHL
jgi:hypothetical protein